MRIATFNVNSINARLENITPWLQNSKPDVVLLQEIKCETHLFPSDHFHALGYHSIAAGQKAYNGVAILSKQPCEVRFNQLPGNPEDVQARYLEVDFGHWICASIYLPNGNPVDSDKFPYKLDWMQRLKSHIKNELLASERLFVLGGDYNICPHDKDCYDPHFLRNDAVMHPLARSLFRSIVNLGVTEAFDALYPQAQAYSYWDYMKGRFDKDMGLRIDHFLLSPEASDLMNTCTIDRTPRAQTRPSDHTPVILEINL